MTPSNRIICMLLIVCSGAFPNTESARILSVIPFPMKSHDIVYKPLILELAKRGHQVTAITTYPMDKNITNYREIVFHTEAEDWLKRFDFYEAKLESAVWKIGLFELFPFWDLVGTVLEDIFTNAEVDKLINNYTENDKFDLIICECFFGSEALLAFGELYKAPTIAVGTFGSTVYMNQYSGNPLEMSYYPMFLLPYTNKMTFIERAHNVLLNMHILVSNQLFHVPHQEGLVNKYFGNAFGSRQIPSLQDMATEVSMLFLNIHTILGYTRPNFPNVIDVGGLHIQDLTNDSIDQDLQKQLDNAKNGIIYFSLGSNVNIKNMPSRYKEVFQTVFSKLPQTIFWKSDHEPFHNLKNVIYSKWFIQQQILGHKNCKAFITHGGILSLEEATYHAVPIIGIPFFGEQMMNVRFVRDKTLGIELEYDNITVESLSWALDQVLHNKIYKKHAEIMSSIFRDSFNTPLEKAVYWTEYVIRHDGAQHLRSVARLLPWYKLLMLDILFAVLLVTFITFYILYKFIRFSCKFLRKRNQKKQIERKKKIN